MSRKMSFPRGRKLPTSKRRDRVPNTPRKWVDKKKKSNVEKLHTTYRILCQKYYTKVAPPFSFGCFQYIWFVHNHSEAIVWLLKFTEKKMRERLELYIRLLQKIRQTKTPKRCKGSYRRLKGAIMRKFLHQIRNISMELEQRTSGKVVPWSSFIRTVLRKTGGDQFFKWMREYGNWFQH